MTDLELTAGLLLDLGCPYINQSESIKNIVSWLQGLNESEERGKFVAWAVNLVAGQTSNTETGLSNLGLLGKSDDARGLGKTKDVRDRVDLKTLLSLLHTHAKGERSKEELSSELKRVHDFTDALAETVSFFDQLNKPIPVLDYQMEKELVKLSSSAQLSYRVIRDIHRGVETEKENLQNSADNTDDICSETVMDLSSISEKLERVGLESGKFAACVKEFDVKYNSDLKPVLKSKSTYKPVYTKEVSGLEEKSRELRQFLEGSQNTVSNINNINSIDNNFFNPNFSSLT